MRPFIISLLNDENVWVSVCNVTFFLPSFSLMSFSSQKFSPYKDKLFTFLFSLTFVVDTINQNIRGNGRLKCNKYMSSKVQILNCFKHVVLITIFSPNYLM